MIDQPSIVIQWLDTHVPNWVNDDYNSLIRLLRYQDRNTRHACAEAVLKSDNPVGDCINVQFSETTVDRLTSFK